VLSEERKFEPTIVREVWPVIGPLDGAMNVTTLASNVNCPCSVPSSCAMVTVSRLTVPVEEPAKHVTTDDVTHAFVLHATMSSIFVVGDGLEVPKLTPVTTIAVPPLGA
jgi:heme/copper-type cytochrome/quinol oxidase subunit 2